MSTVIDERTPNLGLTLPAIGNKLKNDVARVRSALTALDAEVAEKVTAAFVASAITIAINDLVDGAPGALDTLKELSAAMADDSNFAVTVTNALAAKAAADLSNVVAAAVGAKAIDGGAAAATLANVTVSAVLDKIMHEDERDPAAADDAAAGYVRRSRWLNTVTGSEFVCIAATAGAAVWKKSGGGGGASSTYLYP